MARKRYKRILIDENAYNSLRDKLSKINLDMRKFYKKNISQTKFLDYLFKSPFYVDLDDLNKLISNNKKWKF